MKQKMVYKALLMFQIRTFWLPRSGSAKFCRHKGEKCQA